MKITKNNIIQYAKLYDKQWKGTNDEEIEKRYKGILQKRRYLTRDEFIETGMWKSKRPKRWYYKNSNSDVHQCTKKSFSAQDEEKRIDELFKLYGVGYPVASVLLHFAFPDEYSILDFRALWSLGWPQPSNYDFLFWIKYSQKLRTLSKKLHLPIRTIDKALWKYSAIHQLKIKK